MIRVHILYIYIIHDLSLYLYNCPSPLYGFNHRICRGSIASLKQTFSTSFIHVGKGLKRGVLPPGGGSTITMKLRISPLFFAPSKSHKTSALCRPGLSPWRRFMPKSWKRSCVRAWKSSPKEHKRLTEPIGRYGRIWDFFTPPENGRN